MSLKELREKSGLTKTEVANKAGMSWSHYNRLENGSLKMQNITALKFMAIADALGVDPHDLLKLS